MTALSPVPNATGSIPLVSADAAPSRRVRIRDVDGTPPAWAQLGAAIAATSIIWVAVAVALSGYVLAAVPVALLAVGIFTAAVLPDLLALRWDRLRAEQDAEDAA